MGKAPGHVAMTQEQINAVLVEHGRAGRRVVRLKGGDPFVFGRGGEEADACLAAGHRDRGGPGSDERDRGAGVRRHPGHAPTGVDERHDRHGPRRSGKGRDRHRLGRARARRWHARHSHGRGSNRRDLEGADRGRTRRAHAGRRGALGNASVADDDPIDAGRHRERGRRSTVGDRRRRRSRARLRLVRATAVVRAHDRRHPSP